MNQEQKNLLGDVTTPSYVLFHDTLKNNIRMMKKAFSKYYPYFNIAYSYKTNYLGEICAVVTDTGCLSEVVSPMELSQALQYTRPNNIVYNGVIRDDENKVELAHFGARVNFDNLEELVALNELAREKGYVIKLGVRLNFPVGTNFVSRFGVDVKSAKGFHDLVETLKSCKNVKLVGVHCHISKARELEFWRVRVEKMVEYIQRLEQSNVLHLEYVDFGSNMYGPMEKSLAVQFSDKKIPTFDDYAYCIGSRLLSAMGGREKLPLLIVESGTPVVANSMGVISSVVNIKKVQGKTFVTMDCSTFNLGAISKVKNVPIEVFHFSDSRQELENATLTGYTCIEDDVLLQGFSGELGVGDKILFKNVGAYSYTFSPNFIMPTLGVVNKYATKLKERIDFQTVFREDI